MVVQVMALFLASGKVSKDIVQDGKEYLQKGFGTSTEKRFYRRARRLGGMREIQ